MHFRPTLKRGSVLIVAMLLAAIVAVALTSYLQTATTALRLSQRSFQENDAMNLVEIGLEQALWSFNQTTAGSTTAWTSPHTWTPNGNDATCAFTGFTYSQNATGVAKVYVRNYNSNGSPQPLIVVKGIITPAQGPQVIKMVQVNLQRRSLFGNGMVGRNGITFSGNNASVDSWNSDPDKDPATAPVPYNAAPHHALGTIAALSVSADISVNNANIYGYASVGGDVSQIEVGPQGLVGPFGAPNGYKDPTRCSGNFVDNLPPVTVPVPSSTNVIASTIGAGDMPLSLPRPGVDTPADDGIYYYSLPGISTSGNTTNVLTITDNVVLLPTAGSGTTAINFGGQSSLVINSGASLQIYAQGDVSIAGQGVTNGGTTADTAQQPINFQIWGTNTSAGGQTISIVGNGVLSAVAYAPNATIRVNGNGDVFGAFVGNTVTLTGNAAFHYDESLADFGGNNPFRITKWIELRTDAQRTIYATALSFAVSP
ncbi:MAG: hypothetical protein PHQ04_00115 [Opitutaceae bacterium]|nr:hypothetical protein [Opitutaceae bacterium]